MGTNASRGEKVPSLRGERRNNPLYLVVTERPVGYIAIRMAGEGGGHSFSTLCCFYLNRRVFSRTTEMLKAPKTRRRLKLERTNGMEMADELVWLSYKALGIRSRIRRNLISRFALSSGPTRRWSLEMKRPDCQILQA